MSRTLILTLLALWPVVGLAGPPALAPVFGDAMVLQRGVPVPVWGTADPGAAVTVAFADQRKTARADERGKWHVTLDALPADADPRELTATAGADTTRVRDVVVGEVWVAAGQSNMEWPLAKEAHAAAELPRADVPGVRLLNLAYAGQYYFARPFGPDVRQRLTPAGFFRGTWQPCTPRSAANCSAVAYYFAAEVHRAVGVPVGVIHLAVGGSPTEAWVRREALAGDPELRPMVAGDWLTNDALDGWCRQRGRENLGPAPAAADGGPNHPFKPGFLWDAGPARLLPFPVRGVLWYQGESNSLELRRVRQHGRLFPLLVADWRKQWGIGDFPFLYCQLSGIGTEKGYQSQHWPEFRDGQRRMLGTLPNAGMAVTSDLGHPTDVHPRNKKEVGRRLALWALAKTYGKDVPYSGPLPTAVRRDGAALVVAFDHTDGGLKTSDGKPAVGFEVAGADDAFHPATATLGADAVTLVSEHVPAPVAARYGWRPYTDGNLSNGAGLPASTFRMTVR